MLHVICYSFVSYVVLIMPILYIFIYIIIILFCVLQLLVLLIVCFNLFLIRNISFSFTCHKLCVLFPLCKSNWTGLIVWLWILITKQSFIISIDEINELSLSDWLEANKAFAHFPMGKSISPYSPCKSINHARHNSGYWLYTTLII